jgi:hypothetical protein
MEVFMINAAISCLPACVFVMAQVLLLAAVLPLVLLQLSVNRQPLVGLHLAAASHDPAVVQQRDKPAAVIAPAAAAGADAHN